MQARFSFITFDGGFDVPQHLLTGVADERTQCGNGISGVEVKDTEEIFMLKVFAGVQTAAGHKGIGGADGGGIFECHPYIVVIILLKERICKDFRKTSWQQHSLAFYVLLDQYINPSYQEFPLMVIDGTL